MVWWSGRWIIGFAPQFCAECQCFRVRGSHRDPIGRWDSPMWGLSIFQAYLLAVVPGRGLFIPPKRRLKWDPSLFPGCHPWQGFFFHHKRPLKCTFGPTLGALWLSVALGPSRGVPSRFVDRRLQRNWGSGTHPRIPRIPRIPRKWVRSRSSDPPFHAQGSQDDVSSQANALKLPPSMYYYHRLCLSCCPSPSRGNTSSQNDPK